MSRARVCVSPLTEMEIDGASSVKFEAVAKASASVQQQQSATSSSEKMCEVCKVVPYQFHHFGAFVCNRCRAFFRRTVRRERLGVAVTQCLTTKRFYSSETRPICDITLFRGACQACRYATCIAVGMKPESVLTDADRVKKYSKKRLPHQQSKLERQVKLQQHPQLSSPVEIKVLLEQANSIQRVITESVAVSTTRQSPPPDQQLQQQVPPTTRSLAPYPMWSSPQFAAVHSRCEARGCRVAIQENFYYEYAVAQPPWLLGEGFYFPGFLGQMQQGPPEWT